MFSAYFSYFTVKFKVDKVDLNGKSIFHEHSCIVNGISGCMTWLEHAINTSSLWYYHGSFFSKDHPHHFRWFWCQIDGSHTKSSKDKLIWLPPSQKKVQRLVKYNIISTVAINKPEVLGRNGRSQGHLDKLTKWNFFLDSSSIGLWLQILTCCHFGNLGQMADF